MGVYIITYDLHKPTQDYKSLHDEIKALGIWAKPMESFWILDTKLEAKDIRDKIKEVIDSNDKLLVMEVKKHWASSAISKGVTDWLKHKNRSF